ncbi:hypothetical protein [Pseudomonas delhiensis]|uniref:hypothetical protein n=1 Tax=Pseudomonas delhiensis TaxID=366289 RepID=UPI00315AA01F
MSDLIDAITDVLKPITTAVAEGLEKTHSPTTRAGHTIERAGKLLEAGISPRVVATHLTDTSANGHVYSEQGVKEMGYLWQDSKTRVGISVSAYDAFTEDLEELKGSFSPA